jgi:hypothetical protein
MRTALIGIGVVIIGHAFLWLTIYFDITPWLGKVPIPGLVACYGTSHFIWHPRNRPHWKFNMILILEHAIAMAAAMSVILVIIDLHPQTPTWALGLAVFVCVLVFQRLSRPIATTAIMNGLFGKVTLFDGRRTVSLFPRR